ncbi:MAG: hypothetical protein K6F08_04025 [bacterium]|nr:hypothetical protein [bacterium]
MKRYKRTNKNTLENIRNAIALGLTTVVIATALTACQPGITNETTSTNNGKTTETTSTTEPEIPQEVEYGKPYVLYFSPEYAELDKKLLNDLQLFICQKLSDSNPDAGIFVTNNGDLNRGTWDFKDYTTTKDGADYYSVVYSLDGKYKTTFYYPKEVYDKIKITLMRSADYDSKVKHYRYKYNEKNVYDENELTDLRGFLVEAILSGPDKNYFVEFCSNYDFSKYDNYGKTPDKNRLGGELKYNNNENFVLQSYQDEEKAL